MKPTKRKPPGFEWDSSKKLVHVEVVIPKTGGKQRRRGTFPAKNYLEALTKWRGFREEVLSPTPVIQETKTFGQYVEKFWPSLEARLKPGTALTQTAIVKAHLLPFFGEIPLSGITRPLVQDFIVSRKQYSPVYVRGLVATLSKILRDAVERETIEAFPIRGRLQFSKAPTLKLELSDEERARFLAGFENPHEFSRVLAGKGIHSLFNKNAEPNLAIDPQTLFIRFRWSKPVFVVALETGIRQGDLLSLKWSSVDLRAGWIRLTAQKTNAEISVPISHLCRMALLECRGRVIVGEHVFLDTAGRPYRKAHIIRLFSIAKRVAGIMRRFRFHDLRHTYASRLSSAGVSLQVIAKTLGHSSVKMSERYARPSEEALQTVTRALNGKSQLAV